MEEINYKPSRLSTHSIPFYTLERAKRVYKERMRQTCNTFLCSVAFVMASAFLYLLGKSLIQALLAHLVLFWLALSILIAVVVFCSFSRLFESKFESVTRKKSFIFRVIGYSGISIAAMLFVYMTEAGIDTQVSYPSPARNRPYSKEAEEPWPSSDIGASSDIGEDLSYADLSGKDLSGKDLSDKNLQAADLRQAILVATNLSGADLFDANLSGADLSSADLFDANLMGANLSGADLFDADLFDANIRGANLSDANLSDARLINANLSDANIRGANLSDANIRGANLSDANLSDARLINANLSDANLRGANLSGADLFDANLSDANLRGANLSGSDLFDANLSDANLIGANLSNARNLTEEQLSKARLCRTRLPEGTTLDPDRDCELLLGAYSL